MPAVISPDDVSNKCCSSSHFASVMLLAMDFLLCWVAPKPHSMPRRRKRDSEASKRKTSLMKFLYLSQLIAAVVHTAGQESLGVDELNQNARKHHRTGAGRGCRASRCSVPVRQL